MLLERLEAERRARDVAVVEKVLPDQDVHQAERQRAVSPRADHQVFIRLSGCPGAIRVDADDARPPRARLLDQGHQVDVRVGGVDPPQDHELRPHHLLGVVPRHHPEGGSPPGVGGRHADRPVELARAEGMEEGVAGVVLDAPQRAGVGEGQDRLGSPLGDDPGEPVRDLLDRLVPGDGLEVGGALRPDAPHGAKHPQRRVHPLRVVVHLAADHPAGERVRPVPGDVDDPTVLGGDLERAGGRAVVGTDGGVSAARHRSSPDPDRVTRPGA